jgi:hypothetical protein
VCRVVGVEAGGDQGAAVEGVVVGMLGGLAAGAAVSVRLVRAHACRIARNDRLTEQHLVVVVVAALSCAASLLLGLAPVLLALAVLCVLRAARDRADAPALGLRHATSTTVSALGVVQMKRQLDVPLAVVVAGVVLIIGCRLITWWPGVIIGAAMVLGVLVSAAAAKRRPRD